MFNESIYLPRDADDLRIAYAKRNCLDRLMIAIGPRLLEHPARVTVTVKERDAGYRGTEYILTATLA